MLSLGVMLLLEYLLTVEDLAVPDPLVWGVMAVLFLALGWAANTDVLMGGFVGRLGLALAAIWYLASVGRWLPDINRLYMDAPSPIDEFVALGFLVVAPAAILLAPILRSVPTRYYPWRSENKLGEDE